MSSKRAFVAAAVLASLLLANVGSTKDARSFRKGSWPIRNGQNHQPTVRELRDSNTKDVTSGEAGEIDRLYDELMPHGDRNRRWYPASRP